MPNKENQMYLTTTDQIIFFMISITAFIWISIEITGFYIYQLS